VNRIQTGFSFTLSRSFQQFVLNPEQVEHAADVQHRCGSGAAMVACHLDLSRTAGVIKVGKDFRTKAPG
jgi:hypothetical protein